MLFGQFVGYNLFKMNKFSRKYKFENYLQQSQKHHELINLSSPITTQQLTKKMCKVWFLELRFYRNPQSHSGMFFYQKVRNLLDDFSDRERA